ncbi:MAG: ATP-binding cassette domain-containing protein [Clostridiales bacterium]|jgi:D-methionine transport system ATP-binding protein|nr:ATP-binding cassette domain-containing protein [Clostridiales bacterium]
MNEYIRIEKLRKTFKTDRVCLEVLKGVDLKIEKGDVCGIIGFSGAGKSTLARCVNRLEEPDSGKVFIGDVDITSLAKRDLNIERRKIGMIFQTFNLFESMTVKRNIAYPLEIQGVAKARVKERVDGLLELVGIKEKGKAYPAQLSGGQKQRVGIARALANDPNVLLSDEATSALDPQTTLSVLELLKEINQKLGLTILLITHELEVIKYACKSMAILEDGVIAERGGVDEIFSNPNSAAGRIFLKVYQDMRRNPSYSGGEGI